MGKKIGISLVRVFFLCLLASTYHLLSLQLGVSYASDQFPGAVIDLYTQKEPYSGKGVNQPSDAFAPNEEVFLYVYVTYNGIPLESTLVTIAAYGPSGSCVIVRTVLTDENGIATMSFRIPWSGENIESVVFGTWITSATVEIAQERVDDTLTFEVGWVVEIVSIRTVDENLHPQTIFTRGTDVGIELLLRNIAMLPKNATLTLVACDNMSRPLNSTTILDFEVKPGVMYTYCVLGIPKWATIGYATVFADAFTTLPQFGGVRYCPEASARFVITMHDVAVVSVTPSATEVYVGQEVNITVVAKNEGIETETFKVIAYCDESIIGTQKVTDLVPGMSITLTFNWNTSGVTEGNHAIKAVASTVPGETEIVNNECLDGTIAVKLPLAPAPALVPAHKYVFPRELIILLLLIPAAIVVSGIVFLSYRRKSSNSLSSFIKRFLTNLNAVGGVMNEEAFFDLVTRTEIEMKLNIDPIKVYDALQTLEVVERVSNTVKAVWILTLKGLQFAGLPIDRCCYFG